MKSSYYTAVVTNTYKMAVDSYFSGNYEYDPLWYRELESVSHREYNTGYYFADSKKDANVTSNNGYLKDKAFLAVALEYDEKRGLVKMSQRNKMTVNDSIEFLTPGAVGCEIRSFELFDEEFNPIESTPHPYMIFYMRADNKIKPGDIIRAR